MPFQPQASQAVLNGQDIFRINQRILSSGDIFSIDTSVKAVAIGPDSDLSEVMLTYFDPQVASSVNRVTVGVGRPFFGRIDALLSQRYPGSNQPAKILVSLEDFVDNNYVPLDPVVLNNYVVTVIGAAEPSIGKFNLGFADDNSRAVILPTQFDLICYLNDPVDTPRERSDKIYRLLPPTVEPDNDVFPIIIPYFGRRFATISLSFNEFDDPLVQDPFIGIDLKGIRIAGGTTDDDNPKPAQINLGITYIQSDTGSCQLITKASEDGEFDYLQATIFRLNGASFNVNNGEVIIRTSDREA